ncbi:hypothetical protein NMY22_g11154 [Coprinellus aureogranulatus]|nr:hypothetical protein NMY22_g11154 [Coprinellus aureogranulatus]
MEHYVPWKTLPESHRQPTRAWCPPLKRPQDGGATRGVSFSTDFGSAATISHVLLAACGRDKSAFEDSKEGHGFFTSALIKVLEKKTKGRTMDVETYESLIMDVAKRMPPCQDPQCMGINRNRTLFNHRERRSNSSYIRCYASPKKSKKDSGKKKTVFALFAASPEGILPGDVFTVYFTTRFQGEDEPLSFGEMVADSYSPDQATTILLPHGGGLSAGALGRLSQNRVFYAKRTGGSSYSARIYCNEPGYLLQSQIAKRSDLVDDRTEASLIVTAEGGSVCFERSDAELGEYIGERFPYTVLRDRPGKVQQVIEAWQHFHYHLNRQPSEEDEFPIGQIRMELHFLKGRKPSGDDLLAGEGIHKINISKETVGREMGFTLYNDGDVDVYPYLFYFDPSGLTITPWHLVATGRQADTPLPKRSQLAVGYGDGGAPPLVLQDLDHGCDKDIGYFKLFVLTAPSATNFTNVSQEESPFSKDVATTNSKTNTKRNNTSIPQGVRWGVRVVTILQIGHDPNDHAAA